MGFGSWNSVSWPSDCNWLYTFVIDFIFCNILQFFVTAKDDGRPSRETPFASRARVLINMYRNLNAPVFQNTQLYEITIPYNRGGGVLSTDVRATDADDYVSSFCFLFVFFFDYVSMYIAPVKVHFTKKRKMMFSYFGKTNIIMLRELIESTSMM